MTCNPIRTNSAKNFNSLIFRMFLVTLCCLAFSGIACDKPTSKPAKPQISITTKPAPASGEGYQVAEDVRPQKWTKSRQLQLYDDDFFAQSTIHRPTTQRLVFETA